MQKSAKAREHNKKQLDYTKLMVRSTSLAMNKTGADKYPKKAKEEVELKR